MSQFRQILIGMLLVTSCGPRVDSVSKTQNVFGADDRVSMLPTSYPWSAIGRLVLPSQAACTATLVAKNLVLTAAHCVIHPDTGVLVPGTYLFQPAFFNGDAPEEFEVEYIWFGTNSPSSSRWADWALAKVSPLAGERFGWLSVQSKSVLSLPDLVTVAGYSGDFRNGQTAGVHLNCQIRKRNRDKRVVSHDCDCSRGASGGPLLIDDHGSMVVAGVNVSERRLDGNESLYRSEFEEKFANLALTSDSFYQTLDSILSFQN